MQSNFRSEEIRRMLGRMTTEEKIAQMLMLEFRNFTDESGETRALTALRPEIEEAMKRHALGGVILFGPNVADTGLAVRLVDAMQKANASVAGRAQLFTAIDQEGGALVHLGHGVQMPGNMALGAVGDPCAAEQAGRLIGEEVASIGLNWIASPVVDVRV